MRTLTILSIILLSFSAQAYDFAKALEEVNSQKQTCDTNQVDLCQDLATLSCTDEPIDDGTGINFGPTDDEESTKMNSLINNKQTLILPDIKAQVSEFLNNLKNDEAALNELKRVMNETSPEKLVEKLSNVYADQILSSGKSCMSGGRGKAPECPEASSLLLSRGKEDQDAPGSLKQRTKQLQKDIFASVRDKVIDSKIEKKIENEIFPSIKKKIIQYLDAEMVAVKGESQEAAQKRKDTLRKMKERISDVWYKGIDCNAPLKKTKETIPPPTYSFNSLGTTNALYSIQDNSVRYCAGSLLRSTSEFDLIATLGHEISHSIDPQNIILPIADRNLMEPPFKYSTGEKEEDCQAKIAREYPIPGVVGCLRDAESVHSTCIHTGPHVDEPAPDFSKLPENIRAKFEADYANKVLYLKAEKDGGACQDQYNDQIAENFSDFIASEILPSIIKERHPNLTQEQIRKGYANTHRGNCKGIDKTHPTGQDRTNQNILNNQRVRDHMGCREAKKVRGKYCHPAHD